MHHFKLCFFCCRYVKGEDPECPFCGALMPLRVANASRQPLRSSRARWLAFGPPIALAACTASASSERATEMGAAEAVSDGQAVCPTKSGFFKCGDEVCDRAIQACDPRYSKCTWYGSIQGYSSWCGACPSCECLIAGGFGATGCGCHEDDAGSVILSCGSCYGAPPARIERLA